MVCRSRGGEGWGSGWAGGREGCWATGGAG